MTTRSLGKTLAVIPARGGSKRIPDKNIKLFYGKPMVGYIIDAAQKSGVFDTIHVSTDSGAIAEIAETLGCKPEFMRSDELSGDHTPIVAVLRYVVEQYENRDVKFDTIALLYATAALIEPEDLKKAVELFYAGDPNLPVLSITSYPVPIEWAFHKGDANKLDPINADACARRSQDLPESFFDAGCFNIYASEYLKQSIGAGSYNDYRGFDLPRIKAIDIDTPEDWAFAEAVFGASRSAGLTVDDN